MERVSVEETKKNINNFIDLLKTYRKLYARIPFVDEELRTKIYEIAGAHEKGHGNLRSIFVAL